MTDRPTMMELLENVFNDIRDRLDDLESENETLRQQNDILSYKIHRYERFLHEKGYVMQETVFVDITEDKPGADATHDNRVNGE